ncbi:phage protein Gp27 family protein [Neisseria sp. 27098_8_139]|uniref:DUF3486 family protein n=1 Tax=Neisseria sp. 27098_8_139 TaxID=3003681 RepID=UPI00066CF692
MAKRSVIDQLPEAVRHEFERKLVENGFADYQALSEWLQQQGYEISRSAAHRYGQKVQRRFSAIKSSTEAARLIAEGAADEGDTRSEALVAMVQSELFEAMLEIGEMEDLSAVDRFSMVAKSAKNIATLTSASTRLKEYQAKVKAKVAAAAENVAKQAKKGGLSDAAAEAIRKQILGIAS